MILHANPAGPEIDSYIWSVLVNGQKLDLFRLQAESTLGYREGAAELPTFQS